MICCVPDCENDPPLWTVNFPCDEHLVARWKAAIQAGTGQCLSDESVDGGALQICNLHFDAQQWKTLADGSLSDKKENHYQEPSIFIRDNVQFLVANCRLCHCFATSESMFDQEVHLVNGQSLQCLADKYFSSPQTRKKPKAKVYICERCTIQIDMTHAFWKEISDGTKQFEKLLRSMAKEKLVLRNAGPLSIDVADARKHIHIPMAKRDTRKRRKTLQDHSVATSEYNEEQETRSMFDTEESIIVKEEPQLAESDPLQVSQPGSKFQRFKCYICDTVLKDKVSRMQHLMIEHPTQDSYRCDECSLSFHKITSFNNHLSTHDASKRYKCTFCPARFTQQDPKIRHEAAQHGMQHRQFPSRVKKVHICPTCGKQYLTKTELNRHDQVQHRGEANARCEICDKPFASARNLEQHLLSHRDERLYKCTLCDISYRQRLSLIKHNKKNHNESDSMTAEDLPPLATRNGGESKNLPICNVCQRTFEKSKEVVAHFKEVHPEMNLRAFDCAACDETFFSANTLYNHRYIHSDKFACDQCGKRHYSGRTLVNHRRVVHGVLSSA